jgi:multidrug transporter EmrE-like cation transporter
MSPFDLFIILSSTIFAGVGAFFFKVGAQRLRFTILALLTNWRLYLGVLFFVLSNILFIIPLKRTDLSILYGFAGLNYVWTLLIGWAVLKESIQTRKIIAIILIVIGVLVVNI